MAEKTFIHTQFSEHATNYYKGVKRDIAPPSPELSSDDLIRELDIVDIPSKEVLYLKTQVSNEDIVSKLYEHFIALIYWEIPGRSGIVLSGILLTLILTRYYSLLYLSAAAFTIITGFNLVFVNAYNLIRTTWTGLPAEDLLHPYHIHVRQYNKNKGTRDTVKHYVNKSLDIADVICDKGAQIIFVQDTKHTAKVCALSGLIYFVTGLVSTKTFVTLAIICFFSLPISYKRNQQWVDEQAEHYKGKLDETVEKYSGIFYSHVVELYQHAKTLALEAMNKLPNSTAE